MKLFYTSSFFISVVCLGSFQPASAQFKGGSGDGVSAGMSAGAVALGRNIFTGGSNDGTNLLPAAASPLGRNIFRGGIDDGNALSPAAGSALGRNIFTGGSDDGNASSLAANSPLGRNIFTGGSDDGVAVFTGSKSMQGRNIYTGGNDDGWAMAFSSQLLLPVTLLSFGGQWQGDDAALNWQTGSETNTLYFGLQRSFDGIHFTDVQQLPAAGESTTTRRYQYTDKGIKATLASGSRIYYRLCTADKNGGKTYSAIVVLTTTAGDNIIYAVFPNPARDVVTITCSTLPANGDMDLILTDANGKTLIRQKMTGASQQLSVASFAAGTYFLQLLSKGTPIYHQKIIILK